MKRHPKVSTSEKLAGEEGFEPSLPDPEPGVLPLDYSPATDARYPIHDVTESKSRPLPGLLNGIIPLNLPLNLPARAKKIGQQIQSLLPGPLTSTLGQVPFRILFKDGFAGNATEVVFLLHSPTPFRGGARTGRYLEALCYERASKIPLKYDAFHSANSLYFMGDAGETVPLALRGRIVPHNAKALLLTAPSTPPEYLVEVWP